MKIIRVFPRRTSMTPTDDLSFVGEPPLFKPEADLVHVSCTFTWDMERAIRLQQAWAQYYETKLGGAAFGSPAEEFVTGRYVRNGVIITSRGCNNHCQWCLVPEREGKIRELAVPIGNNLIDNNFLQCSKEHRAKVFDMLRSQHDIRFTGGLDARLLTDSMVDDLRSLRIKFLFFAADTKQAVKPLAKARGKLDGFKRDNLRCFVLLAYDGETISQAIERLLEVWHLGFLPFAQLYQPPDHFIQYSDDWRMLARVWMRPALMKRFVSNPNTYLVRKGLEEWHAHN